MAGPAWRLYDAAPGAEELIAALQSDSSNLYAQFEATWRTRPDDELLATAEGRRLSWRDLDALSSRMAACLASAGVVPGDRVSAQVEKSPEALGLYLACLRAGFVFHPLNPAYRRGELDLLLCDAEPAVVVCDARSANDIAPLAQQAGAKELLTLNPDGSGSLIERCSNHPAVQGSINRGGDEPAALLYTSGTTGRPKGIVLSHANLLHNARTLVHAWGFSAQDRLLHALPTFHVHGLFVAIGCALLGGASMRWLAGFRAAEVIRFLPECSVFMGVPTYYTRLLAEPAFTREVAAQVRLFVSGSAPLLPETFAAFEERTGHRILERYGMTETNMNTSNPLQGPRKPGTVGPPLPGIELRIVDAAGQAVGRGEIGGIEVRGPNVFARYWKSGAGEARTSDGYFATGDLGFIDADGYVTIAGRAKDLVITGGLNVYPREVEEFIDALPGVGESAVIGVPHPDFGEAVVAVVVATAPVQPAASTTPTERSVIDACKAGLADFKVPKRVIAVAELPRNSMGKVQKNMLREAHKELFAKQPPKTAQQSGAKS